MSENLSVLPYPRLAAAAGGQPPGGGGGMHQRMTKLEEQVATLVVDVAVIKSNYATRHDVEGLRVEMHQSMSGLKDEMSKSMSGLKDEMSKSMSGQKDEMSKSMSGLKDKIHISMYDMQVKIASQTRWLCSVIFVALGLGLSIAKIIF